MLAGQYKEVLDKIGGGGIESSCTVTLPVLLRKATCLPHSGSYAALMVKIFSLLYSFATMSEVKDIRDGIHKYT